VVNMMRRREAFLDIKEQSAGEGRGVVSIGLGFLLGDFLGDLFGELFFSS